MTTYSDYSNIENARPYDLDAISLFNRMIALGETPSEAVKLKLSAAFSLGKTKAFWAKMDAIWLWASYGENSSLLNILADAFNCTKISTPTFNANEGWTTNGTTGLNTNFTPSSAGGHYTANAASMGFFIRSNPATSTAWHMGTIGGTYALLNARGASNYINAYLNNNTSQVTQPATISANHLIATSRTSSTRIDNYMDNTSNGAAVNSGTIPTHPIFIGGYSNTSDVLTSGKAGQFSFGFVGGAIDATDISDMISVFVTGYLTSIGAI